MKRHFFSSVFWLVGLIAGILPARVLAADPTSLDNPLGDENQGLIDILANLSRFFVSGIAFFATLTFLWGGLLLMTSRGDAEKVKKGKNSIVWAMIGMAVAIMSYSILSLFFDVLTGQALPD